MRRLQLQNDYVFTHYSALTFCNNAFKLYRVDVSENCKNGLCLASLNPCEINCLQSSFAMTVFWKPRFKIGSRVIFSDLKNQSF